MPKASDFRWRFNTQAAYEGVSVVYRRGQASVSLTAVPCSQLLRTTDGRGNVKTERTERDFQLLADELVLNGAKSEPEAGDYIDWNLGETMDRFELMPINNEPAWRYADPFKVVIRAHTKFRKVL